MFGLAVHCRSTGKARLRRLELRSFDNFLQTPLSRILPWSPNVKTSFSEPTTHFHPFQPEGQKSTTVKFPTAQFPTYTKSCTLALPPASPNIRSRPSRICFIPARARTGEWTQHAHTNSSPAIIKLNSRHRSCPRPTPLSKLGHAAWALCYPLKYSLDARPAGL